MNEANGMVGKTIINFQFKIKCSILTSIYTAAILIRVVFLLHLWNCATKFIIIYTLLEWRKRGKCSSVLVQCAFFYACTLRWFCEKWCKQTLPYFSLSNEPITYNYTFRMMENKKGRQQFKVLMKLHLFGIWMHALLCTRTRKMLIFLFVYTLRMKEWVRERERARVGVWGARVNFKKVSNEV